MEKNLSKRCIYISFPHWTNNFTIIFFSSFSVLVSSINCYSVKLATKVQNFFTAAKLIAIAVITIGGFVYMGRGEFTQEI